ncbi:nucleoside kinase [Kaistia geumhonensis]|uniref:Thymidylate kinase n=1 Tax=Kaistia geumhonensis TaxID=410839 RepID=A0ABU0M9N9_9HYPH|nr:nucleoside kinase [Kaistia geumhonensis]MCX5480612.1 nucleoside kinase [Kaistia geumhonensis]MDQ0517686.1 thymidylate kinase [Kaistia geumhonensis]
MGIRNYLVEGGSGTGKTSVATELERRGHHTVHGDRVLACQGDPETGARLDPGLIAAHGSDPAFVHDHHIWDVARVEALVADRTHAATFFCGGARNTGRLIHLFDAVFVLEIDRATLERRLEGRANEWGSEPAERALIFHHHERRESRPEAAIPIDATAPLTAVVDEILRRCG